MAKLAISSAFLVALLSVAIEAHAACKKGQVLVKHKTAMRRGPGLNYQPTTMIDEGKCWKLVERSSDDQWVMIEGQKDMFGWVPASVLAEDDRAELSKDPETKKKTGPIGSGQERGFVVARTASALLAKPEANAEARRMVPAGAKLLALSITTDGRLIEVRDERGETGWVAARGITDDGAIVPTLPRLDHGLGGGGKGASSGSGSGSGSGSTSSSEGTKAADTRTERPAEARASGNDRLLPKDEDPKFAAQANTTQVTGVPANITLELEAMIALPTHALDSNGAAGTRRYAMNALATGAHLEAKANALMPVRLRIAYDFTLLTGLELTGTPGPGISGQQHDARLLGGYPIPVDFVTVIPELGYAFTSLNMDPALPGSKDIQFISNLSHNAMLGVAISFRFTEDFSADLELAGTLGTTIETPIDLGGPGLAFGGRAGASIAFQIGGGAALVGRYQFVHRSSPFSGVSITDPTITEATLKHTENSFGLGLSFSI